MNVYTAKHNGDYIEINVKKEGFDIATYTINDNDRSFENWCVMKEMVPFYKDIDEDGPYSTWRDEDVERLKEDEEILIEYFIAMIKQDLL